MKFSLKKITARFKGNGNFCPERDWKIMLAASLILCIWIIGSGVYVFFASTADEADRSGGGATLNVEDVDQKKLTEIKEEIAHKKEYFDALIVSKPWSPDPSL